MIYGQYTSPEKAFKAVQSHPQQPQSRVKEQTCNNAKKEQPHGIIPVTSPPPDMWEWVPCVVSSWKQRNSRWDRRMGFRCRECCVMSEGEGQKTRPHCWLSTVKLATPSRRHLIVKMAVEVMRYTSVFPQQTLINPKSIVCVFFQLQFVGFHSDYHQYKTSILKPGKWAL